MIAKIAYIISILISYVPKFIITMKYNNSLSKEGYKYCSNSLFYIDQMKMVLGAAIVSIIPGLNVISGIRTIGKLTDYKENYANHKLDLLSNDIIEKENEQTHREELEEIQKIYHDSVDVEKAEEVINVSEILKLLIELDKMGYDVDENFENMTTKEKLAYVKKLKEEALEKEKELKLTKK